MSVAHPPEQEGGQSEFSPRNQHGGHLHAPLVLCLSHTIIGLGSEQWCFDEDILALVQLLLSNNLISGGRREPKNTLNAFEAPRARALWAQAPQAACTVPSRAQLTA